MNTRSSNIIFLLIASSLIVLFFPILETTYYCIFISLVALISIFLYPQILKTSAFTCMFLFMLAQLVYCLFGKGIPIKEMTYNIISFFYAITICSCLKFLSKKQIRSLLLLFVILLLYTQIVTIIIVLSDPIAVRAYGYGGGDDSFDKALAHSYRLRGMMSYGIGETFAFVLPALLGYYLNEKEKDWFIRTLLLLVVFGGIVVQIMASLATSMLLSIIFCALVYIESLYRSHNIKNTLSVIIVLVILIPIFFLMNFSHEENEILSRKFDDITLSAESGHSEGQVSNRFYLYEQSLNVCLNNPLLGGGNIPKNRNARSVNDIGYHSAILDYWGLYGIFTLFLVFSWRKIIMDQLHILSKGATRYYKWSILSLLMLLLLKGPVTISANFIFSTVLIGILCTNEYYKNNNNAE